MHPLNLIRAIKNRKITLYKFFIANLDFVKEI